MSRARDVSGTSSPATLPARWATTAVLLIDTSRGLDSSYGGWVLITLARGPVDRIRHWPAVSYGVRARRHAMLEAPALALSIVRGCRARGGSPRVRHAMVSWDAIARRRTSLIWSQTSDQG